MEPVTLVAMGALSGGFLFGIYYTLIRSDAKLNMRPGMSAEGLRQDTGAPSFGRTKQEIDRKLAIVEARRRRAELVESRLAAQEAELRAAENARKLAEENDVDPASVKGTGKDGRVTKEDVQNHVDSAKSSGASKCIVTI